MSYVVDFFRKRLRWYLPSRTSPLLIIELFEAKESPDLLEFILSIEENNVEIRLTYYIYN